MSCSMTQPSSRALRGVPTLTFQFVGQADSMGRIQMPLWSHICTGDDDDDDDDNDDNDLITF